MPLDLDAWLEKVRKCEHLAEEELKSLCDYVRRLVKSGAVGPTTNKAKRLISAGLTAPTLWVHTRRWR
jgi:hypothetical protein